MLQTRPARPAPIVLRNRPGGGGIAVLTAPALSWISIDFLSRAAQEGTARTAGDLITIGDVVDYRATGWDAETRALVVELVADRRGTGRRP